MLGGSGRWIHGGIGDHSDERDENSGPSTEITTGIRDNVWSAAGIGVCVGLGGRMDIDIVGGGCLGAGLGSDGGINGWADSIDIVEATVQSDSTNRGGRSDGSLR